MYTLYKTSLGVSCLYLHDAPVKNTNQKILEQYIADAQALLIKKIDAITDFEKTFTEADAVRLSRMLILIMDARKTWEEESRGYMIKK